ncbi:MAG: mechanosensitive ion channel [Deltaproteobacteria bacterium]|nr:mechanosensitive ion channel [Deltaproteobacteria bacterium]
MEPTTPAVEQSVTSVIQDASEIAGQVSEYGSLITSSLFLIVIGMLVVFILHKLTSKFLYPYLQNTRTSKFLYPYLQNTRLIKVIFTAMYTLILVVTLLLVLKELGVDTSVISKVAIISVLAGAVLLFFLVPFLPRLPFMIGQMIEVNGVLGTVDNISPFHTTIRTFDGEMVFIPNPLVLASKITNFQNVPERRITMHLAVTLDSSMEEACALFLKIMGEDERVLDGPAAPVVFATEASASGVKLTAFCWVKNADFLVVRSDLWLSVVGAFNTNERVAMSRPQQEIYVAEGKGI